MAQIVIYLLTALKSINSRQRFWNKCTSIDTMKKTGYLYNFKVDYDSTDVADILAIHKYLIFQNNLR